MAVNQGSIAGPVVGIVGPGPGEEQTNVIIGTTTVSGGTNTYILFDNNGVLGEETLSTAIDGIGSTQGNILYRNATIWTVLAPGTSGQTLITGGPAANPSWGAATFTLNSGTNFGITAPGLIALGSTYTIGATTDNLRFNALGLGVTAPTTAGQIALGGTTSGSVILNVPAIAGSNTLTFPAGTTDFSGTGGTSQFVKQNTLGGAFTVAVVAGSDVTGAALTVSNDTNVTLTLGGTPATSLLRAASITAGWSGQLGLTRGGTAASLTASNGGIVYSTASAFAILSGTATAGQVLQSGASTTPTWSTTTYPVTVAQGDVLYGSASNVISGLTKSATATRYLANTGASNAPNWDQVNLTNGVTGTLPVGNGGTGIVNPTTHDLLIGNGSSAMTQLAPSATSGVPLISQGASADPAYGTAVVAGGGTGATSFTAYAVLCGGTTSTAAVQSIASVGTAGQVLTSNGASALPTMQSISTALDVLGTAQGNIIYRGASAWVVLAPSTSGFVLSTGGAGANPSWIAAGGTGTVTSITPGSGLTSTITATAPGSAITTNGTLYTASLVNAQTGTTYTIADGDRAKLVTGTNASATAYTLPQAGNSSAFQAGWYCDVQNRGAGVITITPTTSTIDGLSSITLAKFTGVRIFSDGANYFTQTGLSSARQTITTTQTLTSGTAATYTPTSTNCLWLEVFIIGGGGGGGSGGSSVAAGSNGVKSTFNSIDANGGLGGPVTSSSTGNAALPPGATGGSGGTGTANRRAVGGDGGAGGTSVAAVANGQGGNGGSAIGFGGGGAGGATGGDGIAGKNYGGGGGGASGATGGRPGGNGGGGGEVAYVILPATTYTYTIGGTAAGGAGSAAGGQGAQGAVFIIEHYN